MKLRHIGMASLAFGCLATTPLAAQVPGFGPGGAPVPPAGAAVAAVAAPGNLWSFLCPTAEQAEACRQKLCACPMGQLLNGGLKPMGALSGGIVGPFCKDNLAPGLAKSPESVGGAAARVKKDAAEAKQRIADVRYLANVDCHYWPEAQAALINALRADRVECVRYEAALALTHGCCCTKDVVRALTISVNCSDKDGNPRENSERVRAQAAIALENCLSKCPDLLEEEPAKVVEPVKIVEPKKDDPRREGAAKEEKKPTAKESLAEEARKALAKKPAAPVKKGGSLFEILQGSPSPAIVVRETVPATRTAVAKQTPAAEPIGVPAVLTSRVTDVAVTATPILPMPAETATLAMPMPAPTAPTIQPVSTTAGDPNSGYTEVSILQTSYSKADRLSALKSLATFPVSRVDVVQAVVNVSCTDADADVRLAAFRILPALGVPAPAVDQVAQRWILDTDQRIREAGELHLKANAK